MTIDYAALCKSLAILAMAAGAATALGSANAADSPYDCDRACLAEFADLYFEALASHDPSMLPLSPEIKYTETGVIRRIGEGIWRTAGDPTYRLNLFDPETGGIAVHAVVPEGGSLTVMALRLRVANRLITEAEAILVPEGAPMRLYQPENLTQPSHYFTRKIRKAEQNNRFELIAAAEGYWRAFETEGTVDYVKAPVLPDTTRYENGMQTTNTTLFEREYQTTAEQFDIGRFKGAVIADRRYMVVDTEIGAVQALVRFGDPEVVLPPEPERGYPTARGASFVSEIFAVTQGKIVEIQAVFVPPPEALPTPWPVGTIPVRDH
jgi:hypothetical protein